MKTGRAFSLLTGVALLGAIAEFNEMTPTAQASLLGAAAETARATAQSWLQNAIVTYNDLAGKTAGAGVQQPPERLSPPPRAPEGKEAEGAPPQRVAARTADAEPPPPAGNPLWVLPLKQLSITRDRPVFSPSRRPPPPATPTFVAPVAVRQPVKPAEPERPAVSLLGTIIGIDDRIGVFLESGTQNIIRLRVGDDHQGWVLRLIKAREVTLVKDHEQVAVLELPPPGEAPALGGIPGMPGMGGIPGMGGTPVMGAMPGVAVGNIPVPAAVPSNHRQQQSRRQGR
jgi:general secretion pathway protein N